MMTAELRRNLWLEFSPQRLIAAPAILMILALLWNSFSGDPKTLLQVGQWCYFALVLLWGSRRAAAAVAEEVNGGTWSGQRLSSLSPGALLLGKLFGATAYVWYAGLLSLGLYLFAALGEGLPLDEIFWNLVLFLSGGILVQASALLFSLALLWKARQDKTLGTTAPQVLALLAGLLLALALGGELFRANFLSDRTLDWFGWSPPALPFVALSVACFSLWAVLGCWRLLAAQLQTGPLPWAWPVFVVFTVVYATGLSQEAAGWSDPFLADHALLPFIFTAWAFYAALFADRHEPLRYRRLFLAFGRGELIEAWRRLPWWVTGWLLLLGVALWRGLKGAPAGPVDLEGFVWRFTGEGLAWHLAFALFLLRDALFLIWMNAGKGRRPDMSSFVYLIVFYGPFLSLLISMGQFRIASFLAPLPTQEGYAVTLVALGQVAGLAFLVKTRWGRLFKS